MKQILYFLIGVLISFIFMMPFVHADTNWGNYCTRAEAESVLKDAMGFVCDSCEFYECPIDSNGMIAIHYYSGGYTLEEILSRNTHFAKYVGSQAGCYYLGCSDCDTWGDSDADGISDDYDLKPDSSESYKAAIVSVCYDENNKVVAGVIQDGEGNQYSFGTMPTDFEGYTIESVTGDLVTYQTAEDFAASLEKLAIDDLNITKQNSPVEIQDDGTIIPGSTDPFEDYKKAEDDQTQAKKPETQQAPSEQPDSNDGDSDRLDKIIKNTSSTNTNLDNIQKYLGITNDYLAKINDKSGKTSSTSSGGAFVSVNTPTADEIGQAVEDNLIDSGQTIDPTTTDNIPDLDKTDKLTQMKTECSDRYDLFINTLKDSDLFTVPFSLFDGPSGNGSSVQTVDIGSWGSSTNRTVAIDYSDYDYVWSLLSSVLLIISSFLAFKILILNRG